MIILKYENLKCIVGPLNDSKLKFVNDKVLDLVVLNNYDIKFVFF
jgi:hypothetical protein